MSLDSAALAIVRDPERLGTLYAYGILDTEPEQGFDDITRLAAQICAAPVALVSFVDADRVWFKSEFGVGLREMPVEASICARALAHAPSCVVEDLAADRRFADLPGLPGAPPMRFYAAAVLRSVDGHPLGTLCVLDERPRGLTPEQTGALEALGRQVMAQLEQRRARRRLQHKTRVLEALGRVGRDLVAELDLDRLLQKITDAATAMTGAQFGAFFYNDVNDEGELFQLYTLSGAPREAFARYPMPRNTAVFGPTFRGEGPVRSADITRDPRYGKSAPHYGLPEGHLPVCSYLAVPVVSRSGEVIGGLFFAHPEPGVFSEVSEQLALGIAAHAAVAIDNARLYQQAAQASQRAERAERQLQRVIDALPVLIAYLDDTLHYRMVNAAYEEWFGCRREDVVGRAVAEVFPVQYAQRKDYLAAALAGQRVSFDTDTPHRTLGVRSSTVTYIPDRGGDGQVQGVMVLVQDITEQVEAIRYRDDFISIAAHELRTPLTSLMLQIQMLTRNFERTGLVRPDRLRTMLTVSNRQVEHLEALIANLLDVSRLSNQRLVLERSRTDLVALVRDVVERYTADSDCELRTELPAELHGDWDPQRLDQVLANLISNACKYGGGRPVLVRVAGDADRAMVEIVDQGPGIAREHQRRIFERFERVSRDDASGLGLGLYIVKQLVSAHGGEIRLDSEPGRGARFVVELPLTDSSGAGADAPAPSSLEAG